MHLDLPHLIYSGPAIDDEPMLAQLPRELRAALRKRNGCIAYLGAIHIRGASLEPSWHSLRSAFEGPAAFAKLYPEVFATDIPFAEEAFGDQFLLRGGAVVRLEAEGGAIDPVAPSLEEFFDRLLTNPAGALGYEPVTGLAVIGGRLEPGSLISVFPPFNLDTDGKDRSFRSIDALEQRAWLADFTAQIRDLPDGTPVNIKVHE
ncbi:MAG: SMI1/KNR4 family protein [Gemmatimonadota bacterium]